MKLRSTNRNYYEGRRRNKSDKKVPKPRNYVIEPLMFITKREYTFLRSIADREFRGDKIRLIKEIRIRSGYGLRDSKRIADFIHHSLDKRPLRN